MEPTTTIISLPLLPLPPKHTLLENFNAFLTRNYLLLIVISFASVFVLVPYIIFEVKRSRYPKLLRDDSENVLQPLGDSRDFRWIQLGNEMHVVLVSDPEIKHAGAALEIDVGASFDPKDIPGLAHFLEHMLFMGSKKYPNVSHFKDFVGLHGGKTNAFTSDEYTKFYFTVDNSELDTALEIFSRFFVDPLFDSSRVEKEILAVHNEYEMNLQKNVWRFFELLRRNANPNNSFHRFTCGNIRTLKILPEQKKLRIQDEVRSFFNSYYSSHRMRLVLVGNHPIDLMEHMAIEKFNIVKNKRKNYKIPEHLQNMPPAYSSGSLGKFIWYKTIGEQKLVSIVFPLNTSITNGTQINPIMDYLGKLISLDGEYGLKWDLIHKGWITSLETNVIQKNPDFLHFTIMITLSEAGIAKTLEIIEEFFGWVKRVEKSGVSRPLFKQFKAISYLNFLFSKKKPLEDDLISLVSNLNAISKGNIPFEDLVSNKEVFTKYDGENMRGVLARFKPENCLIILGAGDLEIENLSSSEKFQNYFNETGEFAGNDNNLNTIKFLESELNVEFDYDSEHFRETKFFSFRKQVQNTLFLLKKPNNNHFHENNNTLLRFRESVLIDKSQRTFEELMQETFTYCDYISENNPFELKINNNFYDFESSSAKVDSLNHDAINRGSLYKCSADYNDSLLYIKKLNQFDEIMKINYATEKINSSRLIQIEESYFEHSFQNFSFKIPMRFVPSSIELKSNCSLNHSSSLNNNTTTSSKSMTPRPQLSNLINEVFQDFAATGNEISLNNVMSQCFYDEILGDVKNESPIRLLAQNLSRFHVWLKTDRSFLVPKTEVRVFFRVHGVDPGKDKVLLGVIVDIINSRNKEILYDAQMLNYQNNFIAHQKGFEIQFSGFSEKIPLLMQNLMNFKEIFSGMQEEEFSIHLDEIRGFYKNLNKAQSLQQLQKYLHKVLRKSFLSNPEIIEYLSQITLKDVQNFMNEKFFNNFELSILFVGNILPLEAEELAQKISNSFPDNTPHKFTRQNTSILNVTNEINSVLLKNNSNSDDENNAVINYYQIGQREDLGYVKAMVLSTLLNSEAFNFLRTEKQLGYVVHSNIFSVKSVDGFLIGVQGSNHTPDTMNRYIEEFLFKFYEVLNNKSEAQFQSIFSHVGANLIVKEADLGGLTEKLWEEVCFGGSDFKKQERYFKKIGMLVKDDILEFFQKVFKIESRKLSLQLRRNKNEEENSLLMNSSETYSHLEEKIVEMGDLEKWGYFQKLE